jgi:SAM-dependent methyltransferase
MAETETETLFHECYDRLFASKDYSHEIDYVLNLAREHLAGSPSRILEIGCGTGNHTLELTRRSDLAGARVMALDIDRWMVERARAKLTQRASVAEIECCSVEDLPVPSEDEGFDLAFALFHVVTYIEGREELDRFFRAVRARVRAHGVFIFDCWNGTAALANPPGDKDYEWRAPGIDLTCHLTSETDRRARTTLLHYQIRLSEETPKRLKEEVHTLVQRLWTPQEMRHSLARAGFQIMGCYPSFERARPAQATDWKILFVVRASAVPGTEGLPWR